MSDFSKHENRFLQCGGTDFCSTKKIRKKKIDVFASPKIDVFDSPTIDVFDSPTIDVFDSPTIDVFDSPTIDVFDSPTIDVFDSPTIDFFDSPTTDFFDSPTIDFFDSPTIDFFDSPAIDFFASPAIDFFSDWKKTVHSKIVILSHFVFHRQQAFLGCKMPAVHFYYQNRKYICSCIPFKNIRLPQTSRILDYHKHPLLKFRYIYIITNLETYFN